MIAPAALRGLAALPRARLAPFPTPLTRAARLGAALGIPNLWLKRDDLIAFGLGGNKVRGLELILADALARDADVILTGAGPLSNHVRATAAAAAWAKRELMAVYWGREPARAGGNFALVKLLGARTRFTGSDDRSSVDVWLERLAADLRSAGRRPYVIPRGGACALGVAGHVLAVEEFAAQCREHDVLPGTVVLAVGSGATYAGWLVGVRALGLPWRVVGYTVSRPASEARARIVALASEGAALAGIDPGFTERDAIVHGGFIGAGYGVPTAEGDAAIELGARSEGVFFDPTYTGKALAGLHRHALDGRVESGPSVVFVHTGGLPTLLARGGETR